MPKPKRPLARTLKVIRSQRITQHMHRITLGGAEMAGYPEGKEGGYVKLFFDSASGKPLRRTYTIRFQRESEIDIDFALHDDDAPASAWAAKAQVGDSLKMSGAGSKTLADSSADWFFFAGDMTALPAISVNLEQLPYKAKGYAVFEILSEEDKQTLSLPAGIDVHWVINAHPEQDNTILSDKVLTLPWLDGKPFVWVACEFSAMRKMRKYFKNERNLNKQELYISSYWKRDLNEDEHRSIKRQDLENEDTS